MLIRDCGVGLWLHEPPRLSSYKAGPTRPLEQQFHRVLAQQCSSETMKIIILTVALVAAAQCGPVPEPEAKAKAAPGYLGGFSAGLGGYGGGFGGYGGGYGGGLGGGFGGLSFGAPAIAAAPAIGIAAAPATVVRTRVVPGPTQLVQPPPVLQRQVIQPPPIVQTRLIQPPAQLVQGPPQVIHEQTPAVIKTAVPAIAAAPAIGLGYKSLLH